MGTRDVKLDLRLEPVLFLVYDFFPGEKVIKLNFYPTKLSSSFHSAFLLQLCIPSPGTCCFSLVKAETIITFQSGFREKNGLVVHPHHTSDTPLLVAGRSVVVMAAPK